MVIGVSNVANVGVNCGHNSVSERDLITVLASGGDLDTHQAADIMTADLVAAQPGDSIASVGRSCLTPGCAMLSSVKATA